MASDLNDVSKQLENLQKQLIETTKLYEELKRKLEEGIAATATGGRPVDTQVSKVARQAEMMGAEPMMGMSNRWRLGGGARVSLSQIPDFKEVVSKLRDAKKEMYALMDELAQLRKGVKSGTGIRNTARDADGDMLSDFGASDLQEKRRRSFKSFEAAAGTEITARVREITNEILKLGKSFDAVKVDSIKTLDNDFKKFTVSVKNGVNVVETFPLYLKKTGEVLNQLQFDKFSTGRKKIEDLKTVFQNFGLEVFKASREFANLAEAEKQVFTSVSVNKAKKATDGFEEFTITLKNGGVAVRETKVYVDQLGTALSKIQFDRLQAGTSKVRDLQNITKTLGDDAGLAATEVALLARGQGKVFSNVSMSAPVEAANGWNKYIITLKEGGQVVDRVTRYINAEGQALTELKYKAQQAESAIQKFNEVNLRQQLGADRYAAANKEAIKYGYTIDNLKKVQSDSRSQVSFLTYQKKIDGVTNQLDVTLDKYGRTLVRTNKRLLGFGDSIIRNTKEILRWSIGIGLVYGTMYKLQEMVKLAIDNESKLADVAVILGDAQRDVNSIFADAAKVAYETGESINAVLDTYTYAYRAIGDVSDAMERTTLANQLLTDSTILNKLSTLDAAQSIDVLAGSLRQMQGDQESSAEAFAKGTDLLDKWVMVTRNANVDLATLSTAFSITAESALNSGATIEELNAIIASLSAKIGGLGGRETGNAVRALIGGIYQQQAASALQKYGIAVKDTTGQMRPFLDISEEIYNLYSQGIISESELNKLGYTLGGGVRRGQQYVAFLSDLKEIQRIVTVQSEAEGAAQEALGRKIETTQTAITRLSNAFQKLAQTLGSDGGVLDTTGGFLLILENIVEVVNTLTKALGGLTIPIALAGISQLLLGGKVGSQRLTGFNTRTAGFLQGPLTSLFATMGVGGKATTRYTEFGKQEIATGEVGAATVAASISKHLLPSLIGAYPAIGRIQEGKPVAAGAAIGGAILGSIVSQGKPIGAIIGGMIADKFVGDVLLHKEDFSALWSDLFLEGRDGGKTGGKGITKQTLEEQQRQLTLDIFKAAGGGGWGSQISGNLYGWLTAISLDAGKLAAGEMTAGEFFSREPDVTTSAETGAMLYAEIRERGGLLFGDDELSEAGQKIARSMGEWFRDTPIEVDVNDKTARIYTQQYALEDQYKTEIDELSKKTTDELRDALAKQKISPAEFSRKTTAALGFSASLSKFYTAIGESFDEANDKVKGTEETLEALSRIIVESSDEGISRVNQLIQEYYELDIALEKILTNTQGQTTALVLGVELNEEQIRKQLQGLSTQITNELVGMETAIAQSKIDVPGLTQLDILETELPMVMDKAKELEQAYMDALTPDERTKYIAQKELATSLVEIFAGGVGDAGKMIQRITGIDMSWIQQAFKQEMELGNLTDLTSTATSPGFQTFNVDPSVFSRAIGSQYTAMLTDLVSKGYKPDETEMIPILNGTIMQPLKKDWKIVQFLLQEILDTEKKQLDGIYNLPTDASFFVPFTGYKLGYGGGGGGGGVDYPEVTAPGTETETEINRIKDRISELASLRGIEKAEERFKIAPLEVDEEPKRKSIRPIEDIHRISPFGGVDLDYLESIFKPLQGIPHYLDERGEKQVDWSSFEALLKLQNADLQTMSKFFLREDDVNYSRYPSPEAGKDWKMIQKSQGIQTEVSTSLSIDMNSTVQLMVDGRALATVVKQYLLEDLLRYDKANISYTL